MNRRVPVPALLGVGLSLALLAATMAPAWAVDKNTKSGAKTETKQTAEAKAAEAAKAGDAAKTAPAAPSQEEMMAAMMKMASPGAEHAALNPLAGTWKTTTRMWTDPAGEPMTSEGTCERNWIMGGRYLVASYKGMFQGMPFEGMEVLGYDNMKKQYISSWVDNMGTGIMLSQGGAMDPSTRSFTLTGSFTEPSGKSASMREVTNIVDGNTYTMTMFANDGSQEAKMMEITYTRVK